MLPDKDAIATVAVSDLKRARQFYEGVLEFAVTHVEEEGAVEYRSGRSRLLVYQSEFAGGYDATVVTWNVGGDIAPIVAGLKAKGVTFEHYDLPDTQLVGDIHHTGRLKVAWFKDPDGNILSLVGE